MIPLLATNWWSLLIRGVLAIIAGLIAFIFPGITLGALVILFGVYALLDGVLGIVGSVRASRAHERWGWLLFEGICGIVAGAITVLWPALTAFALIYLIGAWALVTGALEIATAIQLRRYIPGEWMLILSGLRVRRLRDLRDGGSTRRRPRDCPVRGCVHNVFWCVDGESRNSAQSTNPAT
jgi:uncharacterized membrane protein HdeD (DUF308 family)